MLQNSGPNLSSKQSNEMVLLSHKLGYTMYNTSRLASSEN